MGHMPGFRKAYLSLFFVEGHIFDRKISIGTQAAMEDAEEFARSEHEMLSNGVKAKVSMECVGWFAPLCASAACN